MHGYFRGQASTESLFILGIAVVLIFALIYAVLPVILDFSSFSDVAQVERSLSKLANTIEAVSAYGPGTQTTIYVYFPAGKMRYTDDGFLIYELTTKEGVTQIVQKIGIPVNIQGTGGEFASAGIKRITVSKEIKEVLVKLE